jgi:DNA-directed RNA polymerase specialized sigma24 family protein
VTQSNILQAEEGLSRLAFSRLLEWLDDGIDSRGETYLEMRRRLVSYFDRRNRLSADDLADETFNRVGRTLEKTGAIAITPPARYCYVVARFVLLEDLRRDRKYVLVGDELRGATASPLMLRAGLREPDEGLAIQEQRLECLDRCLNELPPEQRELVVEYYRDSRRRRIEHRREMAARLGITTNALAIRACRIRSALETALEACCKAPRRQI